MNVLFLMKNFSIGGIEVVTNILSTKFVEEGHNVTIVSFNKPQIEMLNLVDKSVNVYVLNGYGLNISNLIKLSNIIKSHKIELVVNQWGLPFLPILLLSLIKLFYKFTIISVYHNQIDTNARLKEIEISLQKNISRLKRFWLNSKYYTVRKITSSSMRLVYKLSDYYQVLSPSFVELFKRFTGVNNLQKLLVQTNPITIPICDSISLEDKENIILYVGRIDHNQKRCERLVQIWERIEKKYPNWKMIIVGDGPERQSIECESKSLGLKNISFEGFQSPIMYYKRSKLLLLVSEYEGFGLVVTEAMSYGVVPIVYNSYSSASDIIDDGINGVLVDKQENVFPLDSFVKAISDLIDYPEKLYSIQSNTINKSRHFSLSYIYSQWESTFNLIKKSYNG